MKLQHCACALLALGMALPALAQDDQEQPRGERRQQQLLERFDKDGDGQLNEEERAAAREALQNQRGERRPGEGRPGQGQRGEGRPQGGLSAEQIFARLDANNDGKLSKDELGERGQRFAQADANDDGEITKEELEAGLARLREQAARDFNPEQFFARLDENKDGKLTKEELGERGQWLLRADEDENGEVTKEELQAGLERMRGRLGQAFDPEQMFARLDQNQDGKLQMDELRGPFVARLATADANEDGEITKEEFTAAAERLRRQAGAEGRGGPPSVEETFARFDANKDGKLTKDELPERAAEFILRADADNDEAVTKEELQAARERLGQGRGEGRPRGEGRGQRRPDADRPDGERRQPDADQ